MFQTTNQNMFIWKFKKIYGREQSFMWFMALIENETENLWTSTTMGNEANFEDMLLND